MPQISFTPKERNAVREYAARLSSGINDDEDKRRHRVGKLGAIAFYQFLLRNHRLPLGSDGKSFYRKDDDVAWLNFQTEDGKAVGIRTASKDYYRRILVSIDEFRTNPKDYYVGVRISEDERWAVIEGYATHKDIKESEVVDPGEGKAYGCLLDDLRGITKLLNLFPRIPGTQRTRGARSQAC